MKNIKISLVVLFLLISIGFADWNETVTKSYVWTNLDINTSRLTSFVLFAIGVFLLWVASIGRSPDNKKHAKDREEGV